MDSDKTQARIHARQLASQFLQQDDPTGWFEALYTTAQGNSEHIPWADLIANRQFVTWAAQQQIQGNGQQALVIGCGLGDDAEELACHGYAVTAFDVAATAIAWCKKRFPNSQVDYQVADLLAPPEAWNSQFAFVLEAYTLQALPHAVRAQAVTNIARCLAPGGALLVICRGRAAEEPIGDLPWPLTRDELLAFEQEGLTVTSFEDYMDPDEPTVRRFRVLYHTHELK